ncbi:MAG TPA: response regulator transcription factor [Dehalococcoidia bacterium]|nr:response regulator transcription factor [Dehalococcoidia bacterium]
MYHIVLLGNDDGEGRFLAGVLEQHDFRAAALAVSESAFERIQQAPPDLLLVDLEAAGTELLRRLQDDQAIAEHAAVLVMLADESLAGLDGGPPPDDVLLKPTRPGELVARVRLALRRRTNVDAQNVLRCGDLMIDLANYKVTVAGQPVELTYKEYELLRFLMSNPAKVFTREQLLNRVWGYDYFGGARTVDVHIRRLRSKIELRQGDIFIDTVRNVGYRFKDG